MFRYSASQLFTVCVCLLTEGLHSDDFILAQALAGLVVCQASRVEEPALDALPEAETYTNNMVWNHSYRLLRCCPPESTLPPTFVVSAASVCSSGKVSCEKGLTVLLTANCELS